jgi:YVTN family beta-propeller protein
VIDGASNQLIAVLPAGAYTWALCHNPVYDKVYCADSGNSRVTVIGGASDSVIETLAVGTGPCALTCNPVQNCVYVANCGSNSVSIIRDSTLGVAEFTKLPQLHTVTVQPTIARLGAPVKFSGLPTGSDIEVHSLDGRLVSRTSAVRQSTWTWDLRNRSGSLVPAGTYFAVIRSKGKSTSLKLCLVR